MSVYSGLVTRIDAPHVAWETFGSLLGRSSILFNRRTKVLEGRLRGNPKKTLRTSNLVGLTRGDVFVRLLKEKREEEEGCRFGFTTLNSSANNEGSHMIIDSSNF